MSRIQTQLSKGPSQGSLVGFLSRTPLAQQLAQCIITLESDSTIQQMKDDPTLYEFKMNYIQEIIGRVIDTEAIVTQMQYQVEELQTKCDTFDDVKRDYGEQLINIEKQCKEYVHVKEEEIQTLAKKYETEMNAVRERLQRVNKQFSLKLEALAETQQKALKTQQELRGALNVHAQLSQANSTLKSQLSSIEHSARARQHYVNQLVSQLKESNRTIKSQEETIVKFKQDLVYVKDSWETECQRLKQYYEGQMAELSEGLDRKLEELQSVPEAFDQVSFMKLQKRLEDSQRQQRMTAEELERTKEQTKAEREKLQRQISSLKVDSLGRQTAVQCKQQELLSLKKSLTEQTHLVTTLKGEQTTIETRLNQLRADLSMKEQALTQRESELIQSTNDIRFLRQKVQQFGSQQDTWMEKQRAMQRDIQAVQQEKHVIEEKLNNTLVQIDKLANRNTELIKKSQGSSYKKQHLLKALDKAFSCVRKLHKEQSLIREAVQLQREVFQSKLSTLSQQLCEDFTNRLMRMNASFKTEALMKLKDNEEKHEQTNDQLTRQRDNIRRQIKQYESVFEEIHADRDKLTTKCQNVNQQKIELLQELEDLRRKYSRKESQLQEQAIKHHDSMKRCEEESRLAIQVFSERWRQHIHQMEHDAIQRDVLLAEGQMKYDRAVKEIQDLKQVEEDLGRLRKKYEGVKAERDLKVQNLLLRLENQAKHKMTLEKELKELRAEVAVRNYHPQVKNAGTDIIIRPKGQHPSKQRQQQTHKGTQQKLNNYAVTFAEPSKPASKAASGFYAQRDKELSEIKDMIAKTTQLVTPSPFRPERDHDHLRS